MIVDFANTWRVPGFGRKRFLKGIVRDVPDQLKSLLPTSAKVLPDNLPTEAELAKTQDELIAADVARAAAESTSPSALKTAGLEGLVGADEKVVQTKEQEKEALAKLVKLAKKRNKEKGNKS